ncbi:MAG: tetratricopeptide repeat protein [Pyrinomonadaceae bacterium]
MKNSIIYLAIILLAFCLVVCNCSPSTSNSDTNANSDSTGEYTDANKALEDGTRLLDTGETEQAIIVLNQATKLDPDLADAYLKLGIAYGLVEAQKIANAENESAPTNDNATAAPTKPNSQIAFEKAVAAYKKKIAANGEDHLSYFGLGRSLNKLNEDEDAKKALTEAVKLSPENVEYLIALGAILQKLAQYPEAVKWLKKALEIDPESIEAQERLEDAEAGRSRVTYAPTPKKEPTKSDNSNSGNSNIETPVSNSNAKTPAVNTNSKSPNANKPTPARSPTNRP